MTDLLCDRHIRDCLDEHASEVLASEDNNVEGAWFLRGVIDALSNVEPDNDQIRDPNYGRFYFVGYDSIREARGKLGV